jgi:ceramide glucosyltransferase
MSATWLVLVWAAVAGLFSWVAVFRLRRASALAQPRVRRRPPVLLLRPVDAPTEQELKNLAQPIDYPGSLQHVVLAPYRPRLESANVAWLPSDPLTSNRKVGHLVYALAALPRKADVVVLAIDADVQVDGALISSLVAEIQGGASLATAAPLPGLGFSVASHAVRGLLAQSHHAFAALDVMSAGARAVCGKAMALSPIAQAELTRLSDCIGEDLELSSVLHERDLTVSLGRVPAHTPQAAGLRLSAVVERFTRWMQVLRAHRPALFPTVPLLFAPTPVLMVLAAVSATPAVAAGLCLLVGGRIALASTLDPRPGWRFEWLVGEFVLLWCWGKALLVGRTVRWRGRAFSLGKGGRMAPLPQLEPS